MCGIAGLVDFNRPIDEPTLRAMEQTLLHRGPDEGSIWLARHVGLAHRRLRIIDLSPAASQPMPNEDGRIRVIFNGEIYNFKPLREELLKLGHQFRSRSDTEVLVHGYESWGLDLVARLRGMFAFALWDEQKQLLLLARDRLGKKPLFYSFVSDRLAFGSELSVFKAVPNHPLRLSMPAFHEYLVYGYAQSPRSILRDVQRLPAGHYAVFDRSGLKQTCYWSLPEQPKLDRPRGDARECTEALESTLRDAVVCRLESDVPLGCFLSGGVDSSLIAALAQESLGTPLKTYTVGFEKSPTSEAAFARQVAERLGTDHHELSVSPDSVLSEFEQVLSRAAEPLGDDSYVPTFFISRATREHVTVALSGDGGDELFAGYPKYRQFGEARGLLRLPLPWKFMSKIAQNDRLHKSLSALSSGTPVELARWLSTLWKPDEAAELMLNPPPADREPDRFEESWERFVGYPDTERFMLTDMLTYLEGDILVKADRANMAVSLEGRSPLLDAYFVDQTIQWSCHADLESGGKTVLKSMLAKRFPLEWFERAKTGFGMPIEQWFRGPLSDLLRRYTDAHRIRARGLLDADVVSQSVERHLAGKRNFARKLYSIIAFEIWCDQFFGAGAALA